MRCAPLRVNYVPVQLHRDRTSPQLAFSSHCGGAMFRLRSPGAKHVLINSRSYFITHMLHAAR